MKLITVEVYAPELDAPGCEYYAEAKAQVTLDRGEATIDQVLASINGAPATPLDDVPDELHQRLVEAAVTRTLFW